MLTRMKPKVGEMAPDFTATLVDGETETELTLSALRGETVVLVFYPKANKTRHCDAHKHWPKKQVNAYGRACAHRSAVIAIFQ